eukprot:gene5494-7606_t
MTSVSTSQSNDNYTNTSYREDEAEIQGWVMKRDNITTEYSSKFAYIKKYYLCFSDDAATKATEVYDLRTCGSNRSIGFVSTAIEIGMGGAVNLSFIVKEAQLMQWYILLSQIISRAQLADKLCAEANKGNVTQVLQLVKMPGIDIDFRSYYEKNNTALINAVHGGKAQVVSVLIEANADINKKDQSGRTPLFIAAKEGHVEICQLLVNAGASVNKTCGANFLTPLHVAVDKQKLEVVQFLIDNNANLNMMTGVPNRSAQNEIDITNKRTKKEVLQSRGFSPLFIATCSGNMELVQMLVHANADIGQVCEGNSNVFDIAQKKGFKEIRSFLLKSHRLSLNRKSNDNTHLKDELLVFSI